MHVGDRNNLSRRSPQAIWHRLVLSSRWFSRQVALSGEPTALTRVEWQRDRVAFRAPFACPRFTLRVPPGTAAGPPRLRAPGADGPPLKEVRRALDLSSGTWCATPAGRVICVDLPRGASELEV